MDLPLTCRQLYREALEHVYRTGIFGFNVYGLELPLLLPSLYLFPRSHLDTITRLELKFHVQHLISHFDLRKMEVKPAEGSSMEQIAWRLNSSRSRHHTSWSEFWSFLATLKRLQLLRVDFWAAGEAEAWMHEWILAPLEGFERIERLRVLWQGKYLGAEEENGVLGELFQWNK